MLRALEAPASYPLSAILYTLLSIPGDIAHTCLDAALPAQDVARPNPQKGRSQKVEMMKCKSRADPSLSRSKPVRLFVHPPAACAAMDVSGAAADSQSDLDRSDQNFGPVRPCDNRAVYCSFKCFM